MVVSSGLRPPLRLPGSILTRWFILTAAHCFCDSYSQGNADEVDCAVESIGR